MFGDNVEVAQCWNRWGSVYAHETMPGVVVGRFVEAVSGQHARGGCLL